VSINQHRIAGTLPVNQASGTENHLTKGKRTMANERHFKNDPTQTMVYQIRIKGHLGHQWKEWFGGLSISLEGNGDTLITGPVADQAALHGLLKKVRDLGVPLISVIRVKPGQADVSGVKLWEKCLNNK
jgi:hypothetical protein